MIALRNDTHGCIDLSELKSYLNERECNDYSEYDQHLYKPKLICTESPHMSCGGQILTEGYLKNVGNTMISGYKMCYYCFFLTFREIENYSTTLIL